MNWLDLIIIGVLAVGAYHGLSTGVVRQVASFVSLILAIVLGVQLMEEVGRILNAGFGIAEDLAPIVGFVIVFLTACLLVAAVVHLIEGFLKAVRLTLINRVGGCVLGAFKATLLVSLIFLLLRPVNLPRNDVREEAVLYAPVSAALPDTWAWARAEWPHLNDLSDQFGDRVEAELLE